MSLLALERISKRFGRLLAVDRVSFAVEEGRVVGLIGPNGAGKTTVFNLITSSILDTPCSSTSTTSSRVSPESHSSTVQTLGLSDWSLSMVMGRISRMLLVRKFWIPFLVGERSFLSAGLPEVAMIEPAVRNLYRGPRARVIAVAIGDMTSSASFIVGAVVI